MYSGKICIESSENTNWIRAMGKRATSRLVNSWMDFSVKTLYGCLDCLAADGSAKDSITVSTDVPKLRGPLERSQ